jgi:pantoate--beta-alanine ligase
MGYLHEGHMELVRQAKAHNPRVVVSIFVNPTQFGPTEDFQSYPRDIPRDLAMLEKEGVDLVFTPEPPEMYPPGSSTFIDVGPVSAPLEGAARPGHFRGVATVVMKLFNIVQPTRSYFGAKDAQQVRVIQRMVADLDVPVEIVVVPTVREPDGLAMSSRNVYLSPQERTAAVVLWRSLSLAQRLYSQGERDAEKIRQAMTTLLGHEPLVARVEYVSIADDATLEELQRITGKALVSLAVHIGSTRLIDNVTLG